MRIKLFSFFTKNEAPESCSRSLTELIRNVDRYGYTIIDLLSPETDEKYALESRKIFEATTHIQDFDGFMSVGRINDTGLRNQSKQLNMAYLFSPANSFFEEKFDVITGMHLFKKKGKKGILNPHQDSSLTDERIFNSYFLWYPINGTDEDEGTIEVIPFSHKLPILQRSLNISWPLIRYEKDLWKLMKKIYVRKGQAVVIHSRTIHGSGINKKKQIRMASNLFLKPKEAPFLHYYAEQPDAPLIEVYKVDELFYSNKNIVAQPQGYELYKTEQNENALYSSFRMLHQELINLSVSKTQS